MHNKDTFFTQSYKGGFIHTCSNRTTGKQEIQVILPNGNSRDGISTVIGAKRIISKNP